MSSVRLQFGLPTRFTTRWKWLSIMFMQSLSITTVPYVLYVWFSTKWRRLWSMWMRLDTCCWKDSMQWGKISFISLLFHTTIYHPSREYHVKERVFVIWIWNCVKQVLEFFSLVSFFILVHWHNFIVNPDNINWFVFDFDVKSDLFQDQRFVQAFKK